MQRVDPAQHSGRPDYQLINSTFCRPLWREREGASVTCGAEARWSRAECVHVTTNVKAGGHHPPYQRRIKDPLLLLHLVQDSSWQYAVFITEMTVIWDSNKVSCSCCGLQWGLSIITWVSSKLSHTTLGFVYTSLTHYNSALPVSHYNWVLTVLSSHCPSLRCHSKSFETSSSSFRKWTKTENLFTSLLNSVFT